MKLTRNPVRAGLTLFEMLIVLTILAVLAGAAVTLSEGVIDQTRYDVTTSTIANVHQALAGDPADAEHGVAGFVADMGRLPMSINELLTTTATPYGLIPIDTDGDGANDANLHGGWRGPYLRVPAGQSTAIDGWGLPLTLTVASNNATIASGMEASAAGLLPYVIPATDMTGNVTFSFTLPANMPLDNGQQIRLRLFRVATGATPTIINTQAGYLTLPHELMGHIVARAFLIDQDGTTVVASSVSVSVTVKPRQTVDKTLVLR